MRALEPQIQSLPCRRLAALHTAILDARQQSPLAPLPIQQERTLNQHQGIGRRRSLADVRAAIVRFGPRRIAHGVIDAVDLARLRRRRKRRQSEIGIASRLAQYVEFIVDAAAASIRPRVVQRPITVNEAVSQFARVPIPRQQSVPLGQEVLEGQQLVAQSFGGVAVVVQMNLDFAETGATQLGHTVHVFGFVFILRDEETMARRASIAVAEIAE